ncbi:MAG: aconitate hydratase [Verrucomicrobia bacterium]|nr:MAG: aconitate hydratase [Verrucomicrobiota bacterium]
MSKNLAQKLIESHLIDGKMEAGETIGLRIDQTLTQDATGTIVMLEFEATGVPRVKTKLSAQYVDHNLLQEDYKNPDDHIFLRTASQKFGMWYSAPGTGVSHPVHMERFGIPGHTLLGSDSHTPAAGSLGMLAIGAGGLEAAMAMAGEPYHTKMPKIWGVKLTGKLPDWVSAKDVILEMLRRHNVEGGIGKIIEYYGPGLDDLSAMDRHVIANMGAELGATTTVFPSDHEVRRFLKSQGREADWIELKADEGCQYDEHDTINLSELVPLIALPSSPGKVVPVSEVAGREIFQSYIGSSANPGIRDFVIPALILEGEKIHDRVSLDINPTSRQLLIYLTVNSYLSKLIAAGARIHQAGCNGCIGMGQAPATGRNSLRTTPRNFPGRSGTKEDSVYLCSPETATASALTGVITDPRTLKKKYPKFKEPSDIIISKSGLIPPIEDTSKIVIEKGPNIKPLPEFKNLPDKITGPVLLKVKDDLSTDEILPAGAKVLPLRSNIPAISHYVYYQVDDKFYERALPYQKTGFFVVAGENYGQGSSREHAVIAPKYLGLSAILAKGYARIHRENLINFGILPLLFEKMEDYDTIAQEDILEMPNVKKELESNSKFTVTNQTKNLTYTMTCTLTPNEVKMILTGGKINFIKHKLQ